MDESARGLRGGHTGTDEDCCHYEVAGALLGHEGPQEEGDAQRDGGQRVAEVVDQVGE
jgi:hypothetical protein